MSASLAALGVPLKDPTPAELRAAARAAAARPHTFEALGIPMKADATDGAAVRTFESLGIPTKSVSANVVRVAAAIRRIEPLRENGRLERFTESGDFEVWAA